MGRETKSALARLKKDYLKIKSEKIQYIFAEPLPNNILEWHYCFEGPEDSLYAGGFYHGKLIFPPDFPYRPPSIYMLTPNGRFRTNTKICLSNSDFHPDTWNPSWGVATILTGLLSFMKIQKDLDRRREESSESDAFWKSALHCIPASASSNINLLVTNICVVLSFTIFAYIVTIVIQNTPK